MVPESKNFVIKKKKQILDHCKKKKNGWNNLSYKLVYMCMYTMKWGGDEIHVIVQKIIFFIISIQHTLGSESTSEETCGEQCAIYPVGQPCI